MCTCNRKRDNVLVSTVTLCFGWRQERKKIIALVFIGHTVVKNIINTFWPWLSLSQFKWLTWERWRKTNYIGYREMFIWLIAMNSPVQSSAAVVKCWVYTAGVLLHALWSSNNLSPNCFLSFDPESTCCCVYRWNWSLTVCWGVEDWDAVPTAPHGFSSAV